MSTNPTHAKAYYRQQFENQQKLAAARRAGHCRRNVAAKQADREDPIYAEAERERNRFLYRQRRLHEAPQSALAA